MRRGYIDSEKSPDAIHWGSILDFYRNLYIAKNNTHSHYERRTIMYLAEKDSDVVLNLCDAMSLLNLF